MHLPVPTEERSQATLAWGVPAGETLKITSMIMRKWQVRGSKELGEHNLGHRCHETWVRTFPCRLGTRTCPANENHAVGPERVDIKGADESQLCQLIGTV